MSISQDTEFEKLITGSFTAVAETLDLTSPNSSTEIIQITGTWVGTILVEGSNDGTTYYSIKLLDRSTNLLVASITVNGSYEAGTNGFQYLRARSSAWTSGTATLNVYGSDASSLNNTIALIRGGTNGTIISNTGDALNVSTSFKPGTADLFGNLAVSSHHNQIQIDFAYDLTGSVISAYGDLTTTGSGSNSLNTNGSASFSTGVSGTGFSRIKSPTTIIYQEGAEIYCSNSLSFTTPTSANSYQRSGIFDVNNGYFIGFNGLNFGVTSRKSGVDTFVAQASFNQDTLTGTSGSTFTRNNIPEALDKTKINLYRIRYGWYGVSPTYFDILSPDGQWVTFHKIIYPNTFTTPSTQTPNLPVTVEVNTSGADATNLIILAASLTAGVLDIKVPDTIVQPLNLGALNSQISVKMAGLQSAGFQINAGTLIGTLSPQASMDGGLTWINTDFYDPDNATASRSLIFTSANTTKTLGVLGFPGASDIRVIVTAYTSGTAVALLRAVMAPSSLISLGGAYNSTLPTLITGQSTQLQTDSQGRLLTSSVALPTNASKFSFGDVTTAATTFVAVQRTVYTEQTTNSQMSIASSSALDTSAGTGARTIIITYLDQTMAGPFTTTITLNGTSYVSASVSNMCYIEKMIVLTAGSTGSNAGILTLKASPAGAGATVGTVAATDNQTLWAHHYVPTGKTCYISGFSVNSSTTVTGGGANFILRASTPTIANSVEIQVSDFHRLYGQSSSTQTRSYLSPIQVVGPARVRAYTTPESSSSTVQRASFDYIDN